MTQKRGKRGLVRILACCVLAAAVLLAGALPGFAASEAAQDVLDTLAYLQRVSIQPEWLPDIQANESAVQALLDNYQALTQAERQELTAENQADLRAYFEALYEVQGKDVAGVDALFEDAAAVPDASQAASSVASSEPVSSQAASGSAPEDSSVPEPASASVPAATPQPAPAGDSGLGRTLGTGLLMVLAVVAVVLFARFLAALRRADKDGATQAHVDARAQEMFGESYDPVDDPVNEDFIAPPPVDYLDTAPAALPGEEEPPFDEEPKQGGGSFAMFAPDNAPGLKKEGFFARRKREKDEKEAGEELEELRQEVLEREEPPAPPQPEKESPFAPPGGSSRFDKAFGGKDLPPMAGVEDMPMEETPLPKEAEPLFTANPDRRNSITTRSFSAPRTGRPAKMTFRQGDPDDLDGVDE